VVDILRREAIHLWYYFTIQLDQIFWYWVMGMVIGSLVAVFLKDRVHEMFRSMGYKKLGAAGIVAAFALGIASPLRQAVPSSEHTLRLLFFLRLSVGYVYTKFSAGLASGRDFPVRTFFIVFFAYAICRAI